MFNNTTIRAIVAVFILVVFAYSITPKIVLHNLVADHTDNNKTFSQHNTEVSSVGFNCQCDNLVAESPFIPGEHITNRIESLHTSQFFETATACLSFAQLFAELRGPPNC